jgi:L-2-hydroxycarboxylate dehydrogenase (NAD+)
MNFDFLKVKNEDAIHVPAETIHAFIKSALQAVNVPEDHAQITADVLVEANLRGVDTHGIVNLLEYIPMIRSGDYTIPQNIRVLRESDSTALMTNGNGLGFVSAYYAMKLAIEKAGRTGTGQVAICDGRHIGMVAYYPMMALKEDMIGMAMTNGSRSVRPVLGARPRVGTNPIAFAAPANIERPFILDMATSTVSGRKIELAYQLGVPIPEGWAVDSEGSPLTNPPLERNENWSQNPLGNTVEQGGHKGYGLAVMIDILTGVLSGGGYGATFQFGRNMTWVMAIDISKYRPVKEFKEMMDSMIRELHATPPQKGAKRVLIAGDPEADIHEIRIKKGIPIHREQAGTLNRLAEELGISERIK